MSDISSKKVVEHHPELFSRSAMNPLIRHSSAVRNQMTDGFRGQSLVTTGANTKAHYSGVEDEMGKYTFSVRFPCNAEILQVVTKDLETRDGGPRNPTTIIFYRDTDTDVYNFLEVPRYHCIHQYYGFVYNRNHKEFSKALQPNSFIPKGTIIADSPTIDKDGNNKYGIETNYANLTLPETTEDGALVSIEWLDENKIFCVERRQIRFGGHEYLLNIHGNAEKHLGIPPLGGVIPRSGLVFASRRIDNTEEDKYLSPVLLHPKFLQHPEYGDTSVYGRPGAMVTDVTILRGKNERPHYPAIFDKQVHELHLRGYSFWKRIHDVETDLIKRYGKSNDHLKIDPKLKRLFIDALAEISGSGILNRPKHTIIYEKLPVHNWLAIVEYCYWITPDIGYKIADEQGCKHIIVAKRPRAEMPTDTDLNVTDVVADPQAVLSRNNTSRFIIQYINACSKRLGRRVAELAPTDPNKAWELLYDYYTLITDQVVPLLEDPRFNSMEEINDVIMNGTARPWIPMDNSKYLSYYELIEVLREKYRPCYGPVTYVGNSGKLVTTKRPVLIGSLYTMFLEKDGRDGTAVGSSRLHGTFGTPTKPTSITDKVALPGKESPVKIFAEAEKRLTSAACGGDGMRMIDEYNGNILAHRAVMQSIYQSKQPTAIMEAVDWSKVKMNGGRMVRFLHTMFRASGFEIKESEH